LYAVQNPWWKNEEERTNDDDNKNKNNDNNNKTHNTEVRVGSVCAGSASPLNLIIRPSRACSFGLPATRAPLSVRFFRSLSVYPTPCMTSRRSLPIPYQILQQSPLYYILPPRMIATTSGWRCGAGSRRRRQCKIGSHRRDQRNEYYNVNVDGGEPGTLPKCFPAPVRRTRLTAHNNIIYNNIKVYV